MDSEPKMPDHDPTSADAEWKKIQQRTFTRWCNEHLKVANIVIYDLETDLCDGIKLIVLLEVLAHKRVGKYNKKPNFKSQKLENVAIALKFIELENIKLVNIDASDIVRGNLKLILGLIWTLILKYQISMPMGDYEFDDGEGGGKKGKDSGLTPKQALLAWVKSKMPAEIPMRNFTTDWNDGRALAALVDAVEPGLYPDVDPEDLDPNDAVNNAEKAMKAAERYLGVPPVLDAADMCNPKVDEMSIMTYVSYFPEAKCKPGAPHRPSLPPSAKCYAEGPGITVEGLIASQSAPFKVFCQAAGKGEPQVSVFGPGRKSISCEVADNGDKSFACEYSPPEPGVYDIHIKWKGRHIPKSPFRVKVASDLDSSKCYAEGPGLSSGIIEKQWTHFTVYTKGAGSGKLHVDIIDPHLSKDIEMKIDDKGDGTYYIEYKPVLYGKHTINIKFGGQHITKSPFHVNVVSSKREAIPTKVKAYGPGLEAKGVQTTIASVFTVDGRDGGDGELKVYIKGPRSEIPCDIQDNGDGTYTCTYKAVVEGRHVITISWSGKQIPKSPYRIEVSPYIDITKIKAYGPGLEKGVAGQPCKFTVETSGARVDNLGFAVEGPHQAEIKCRDLGNGKCEVIYYPTKPGDYTVHVTCNEQDIPQSPFTVPITPGGDASKCYAEGPGLEPEGIVAGTPAEFTVFTKGAGVGEVEVTVKDDKGRSMKVETLDNKDGTITVVYYTEKPGKYTIVVQFNGKPIPKSPFKINVSLNSPSKCKAFGPGLEKSQVGTPAKFTIETKGAGEGGLGLTIEGPTETKIDCKDKGDGSCDVTYYPEEPGDHNINILFADKHIPGSPFKAKASYPVDASKVVISGPGLESGVKAGLPSDIDIDATRAGDAPLEVEVLNPQNKKVKVDIDEEEPGIFAATYYPEKPGKHTVNVKYGGKHVPNSPKKIDVKPKGDASKCKVKGPGLESPILNEPTNFDVDCKRAGEGDLAPSVVSPTGKKVDTDVKDNGDGTYTVGYTPTEEGPHKVDVKYDGDSVPGTPKEVEVIPKTDTGKVKAYGPGLESALTGQKAQFTVDTREAGPGGLSLAVEGPSEAKLVCKDNKDGTCSATYVPEEPGEYDVHVKYADEHVPGSPFKVKATRPVDASKVKCFGPGVDKAPIFEGVPTHFTVDAAEAGDAPLDVTIETPDRKKIKPDEVTKVDDNTYEVKYTSPKEGRCAVDVKYGGKPVPNSPFRVRCGPPYDASKVKVSGPAVEKTGVVAEEITKAVVDTTEAGVADLSAILETPSGEKIEPTITPLEDGKYEIAYEPTEVGNHKLNVKYGKDQVKDSPFRVKVSPSGDASKVKVSGEGIEKPRVGQLVDIIFDTSEAGKGRPRCSIKSPSGKDVPVEMIDNGDDTYTCKWTPTEEGVHTVDVTYGGEPVRGSPFKVKAVKAPEIEKIKANVMEEVESMNPCVDQPLEFGVDPREAEKDGGKGNLTASIVTPSGKTEYPDVRANPDDTYAVTYTPKEPGVYSLSIKYDEEPIPGSPFQFEVVEGGPERVIAFGKGLERGIVEEPCEFTVVTKDAGPGGLSLAVEGPSKAEIQCIDNGDGSCSVSYVPKEPGEYNVVVKFADKHIPGSPFAAEVFPKGSDFPDTVKRERPVVGKPCDVKLDIPDVDVERDFEHLTGTLRRPGSDKDEPVELSKNPDGTLGVTFTPYEPGEHLISIKRRGKHVQNSPFSVMVQAPRLGDMYPSGRPAEVDLSDIKGINPEDFDKLKATLRRPKSKVDESVKLIRYPDDGIGVSFVPREPGEHFLTVKKDGHPIPGSPFSILVESEEPINAVGAPVDACLDLPGVNLPDDFKKLKGSLKRPSSPTEEPLQLVLNSDNSLSCSFIPKETGKHLVGIKKFNRHVNGSPIPVMVTSPEPVNRAGMPCGVGLEDIPPEDLPKLKAGLQRPGSEVEEPVRIKQNSDNTLSASFFPREEGPHKLHVRKDKKPLPDSPYVIDVLGKDKVEEVHPIGRTCDLGLDIPGLVLPDDFDKLKATIQRPNSTKEEPLQLELYPDDTLGISFVPLEPGEHLIRVKKSGEDVPGSPFAVMVEAAEAVNAVGRPCDCQLDIPELKLPDDLSKLKSTLKRPGSDVEEPIKLKVLSDNTLSASFVPKSPGEHLITVKKNNRHVTGSPFSVIVTATEPANRVGQPVGVGLEDIPVEDLPRLEAGIQRPGSEVEEPVRIKQNSDDTLSASFIPQEEGVHKLHVRKDKKPLPESPYLINVLGKDAVEEVHPVGRTCDVGLDIPGVVLPDDLDKLSATLQRPHSKKEEPVNLELNPDNTLGVSFVPLEPGQHFIRVRKSGKEIPESPIPVMVEPAEPENAVGSPCDCPLNIPGLNLPEDLPKLTSTLRRPGSTEEEPINLKVLSDNTLTASFIPKSTGEHFITVKKRNRPVPGSPFSVMVTAPEPTNAIGKPASAPLENIPVKDLPKLEAGLLRPGSTVEEPIPIKKTSDDNLYAPFIPHEEGVHKVNVRKDKKPVPDAPYLVDVPPKETEGKPTVEEVHPVGHTCDVGLDIPSVVLPDDFKKLTATLQRPNSTKEEPVTLEQNPDNSLGISFVPLEPGQHLIRVKKSGKEIPESPFAVIVEAAEPENAVGSPCDCPLNIPGLNLPEDLPKLTTTLKRPGSTEEEPIQLKVLSDNTLSASFVPKSPGEHLISVKKRNRHLPGSPFSVLVTATEPTNTIGKPTSAPLENIPVRDLPKLEAGLLRPGSTVEEPIPIKKTSDDNLYAPFIPHEEGVHKVNVRKDKKPLPDSPYLVDVPAKDAKPTVEEVHPVGHTCDVGLDIPSVVLPDDFKKLTATLQRPNSAKEEPVTLEQNPDNSLGISFVPLEPGQHLIRVKKSGKEIPESPFSVIVEAAEPENAVGSPCDCPLNIPGLNLPEDLPSLTTTLKRPGSTQEEPIQLKVLSDNTLSASFVPKSPGEHLISVKKRNRHLPGSPFSVIVTATEPTNTIGKPTSAPLENIPVRDLPKLEAGLLRPGSTVEEPIPIKKTSDDNLYAPFIPHEEGVHKVNVRKDKKPLPDSPYLVDVPAKDVKPTVEEVHPVGHTCDVGLDIPSVVLPDDFKKLTATLQRPNSTKEEPVTLEQNPDNSLGISFVPLEPGQHLIRVKKSGKEIPESPFSVIVEAAEPENAVGSPCDCPLNIPGLNLPEDLPSLTTTLKRPGSTQEEPIQLKVLSDNTLSASFVPKSPGEHLISVKKRNRHLPGSPFSVIVTVSEPTNTIGKPASVPLENIPVRDLPRLEAGLQRPGSNVEEPIPLKKTSDDTLYASFVPHEEGVHKVNVRKDKKPLPDSPYLVDVPAKDAKPTVEEVHPLGHTCDVGLDIPSVVLPDDFKKLTATLQRPNSTKEEPVTLEQNPDNSLGISFVPLEPGQHLIRVKKSGKEIPESPFSVIVEAAEPENAVGSPCDCPLNIPGLNLPEDLPSLTTTLKRPGSTEEEPIQLKVLSDNTLSASFVPKSPGEHLISVKKRNRHLPGSPFSVLVTATEPTNTIGKPTSAPLENIPVRDLPRLEAGLQRPGSKVEEPIPLKKTSDDTLYASFVPHEEGVHKINVRKDKKPLPDSPYLVDVPAKDVKPTVEEVHPVGHTCDVGLDIPSVVLPDDFKKLTATLQRPNSTKEEPVTLEQNPDNSLGISFVPLEPGQHLIRVKKSGKEIPESPFSVIVEAAEPENAVGSPCDCPLNIPGLNLPEDLPSLTTTLKRPGSTQEEPIQLKVLSDNTLSASFVPKSPGEHLISVKKRNRHLPGSPFSVIVTVSEPTNTIGKPASIPLENIPVRDLPRLEAGLQRPGSKVEEPVPLKKTSDDTLYASFVPHEEGVHKLHIRKDKKPLPDSPYLVDVRAKDVKPTVEEVHPVGHTCDVGLDIPSVVLPDDFKKLTATLQRPNSTKEEPVTLEQNPDNSLGISFVPLQPGQHLIRVKKSGKEIPESPFSVVVEAAEPENAVGSPCDCPLNIPGLNLPEDLPSLTTTLKRPGSTQEEPIQLKVLSDNTLSASFVPKSPGEHLISVKKRNRHLPGSPFSVIVTVSEPTNTIGKPASVPLENIPARDLPRLEAGLQRPGSKVEEPVPLKKTSDDTLYASFVPHGEGVHKLHVRKDKKPLPDSPYLIDVRAKDAKRPVEEVHPVGRTCDVGLDIPGVVLPADFKKLTATLQRPNSRKEEPVNLELNPDNSLGISFVPLEPGQHLIRVKKSGKDLPEGTLSINVEAAEPENAVGSPCDFPLNIPGLSLPEDIRRLTSTLKRPGSSAEEPIKLKVLSDNTISVSFVPKSPGEHLVTVKKFNRPVPGSPFSITVTASEPTNTIGKPASVGFDKIPAKDLPRLEAGLQRPGSETEEPITIKETSDGNLFASFIPHEGGVHKVNVRKDKKPLPDGAYAVNVPGEDAPVPSKDTPVPGEDLIVPKKDTGDVEDIEDGRPVQEVHPTGRTCDVALDVPGVILPDDFRKLTATLRRPNSKKEEPVTLELNPDNTLGISFVPMEPGEYLIVVLKSGKEIPAVSFSILVEAAEPKNVVGSPCDFPLENPGLNLPADLPKLTATLKRPGSRAEEPITLKVLSDNTLNASFVPRSPGEHFISVKKRHRHVPGSPFSVTVTVSEPTNTTGKPVSVAFENVTVRDLSRLAVSLQRPGSDTEEPIPIKTNSDNTLSVSFIPREAGLYKLHVRKDKKSLPDSPYLIKVLGRDGEEVHPGKKVHPGKEVRVIEEARLTKPVGKVQDVHPVGRVSDVGLNIPGIVLPRDFRKLSATLKRPNSKREEPVKLELNPDNTLGLSVVPTESGKYLIHVKKSGEDVPGSPFSVMVEDHVPTITVDELCDYPLFIPGLNLPGDVRKLTATLKRPDSPNEEPVELAVKPDNTLSVVFIPKYPGEHLIVVKKRKCHVTGSPFRMMVVASEATKCHGQLSVILEEFPVRYIPRLGPGFEGRNGNEAHDVTSVKEVHPMGRTCDVMLNILPLSLPRDFKKLTATMKRPNARKEQPVKLVLNENNTLGISFVPMEPGEHLVRVKKNGDDVPGSPFSILVEATEAVNAVGRPCDCHLDIPGLNLPADLTKIKSTLKRPDSDTEEPVKLKVLSDNTLSVSFVPRSPGEHLINVRKFNRHLSGSPFAVMVTAPETASQSVGRPCGLGLEIPGLKLPEDFDLLSAVLQRPGGTSEEPLKIVLNSDNTLSVSFIPKDTGEHLISVFKNKRHVTGSPFSVMVSGPGPADASKVKAYGPGLDSGVVDEKSEFTVNTRDAGYGGLGLSIEGPSKAEINCVDNEDGTCTVDYVPLEPGDYTIHVRFADDEIPGSPFTCSVAPRGSKPGRRPVVEEGIRRQTDHGVQSEIPAQRTSQLLDDLVSFSPQQPHDFSVDLQGYTLKDLKASVETPSGKVEPGEIVESVNGAFTIRFVTKEGGVYKVSVKNRGRHIPGSPFRVMVDAPKWGGAQKCIAAGPGLERGVVNIPANFTVWTRDAGPGGLAVAIEGPAKTEIDCKDNGDGSCSISYVPTEPGEYTVHVRFADEDIPSAPFKVFVTAEEDERFRDLSVTDMVEGGIAVGQPASFSVETNGPVGAVTASVLAPSGTEGPATISDRGNGSYAIRFVPREVGDHLISVRFDGMHIPGSPFKVKVGGGESYPGRVKAFGPGLEGGVAGQETYFTVDALRAGTGALSLSVDGPAKVRMNCTENPDGTYRVTYHPLIAGNYKITIKFADENISRSPYNVTIASDGSSGNAEKCKPVGSGLHRAVIGEPNAFTVNCSDAGRGSLMVGVEGPAIPAKEIKIKHTGGKVYAVNYTLEEPGEYVLKVLWGEKHIPGSPFHVTV